MNPNGMMEVGLPWKVVLVDDITHGMASVVDNFGKRHSIPVALRRGAGPLPRVGERWILDRTLGPWSFAAVIEADLPVITGSTDDIPAVKNLLSALHDMGLIVNETTNDRIRADKPHTHSNPEGGSTGTDTP